MEMMVGPQDFWKPLGSWIAAKICITAFMSPVRNARSSILHHGIIDDWQPEVLHTISKERIREMIHTFLLAILRLPRDARAINRICI